MQQVNLKKNVGVIHHITIGRPLTLIAKKLYNVLLYKAYRSLLERERHEVPLTELAALVGFNSHNTEVLRDALRQLVDARIEWNVLGDAGEQEWGVTSALAEAKIRGGMCTYAYAPTMREKLANPEVYALIDLQLQRKFTSAHTWSLYENVARYRGVGRTPEFSLEILAGLLGLSDSRTYREYKYLKRDVIIPALTEINAKSDIEVSMLPPKRQLRRVVAVQFEVKERKVGEAIPDRGAALARLKKFGVDGRDAQAALGKHSDEQLAGILDDIQRRWDAKSIDNVRAYTVKVLQQSAGEVVAPLQRERGEKQRASRQLAQREELATEQRHRLEREFSRYQASRVAEEERALTEDAAAQLQRTFLEHISQEVPYVYEQYLKAGERSPLVQNHLLEFKVKALLKSEEQSFERWLEDREKGSVL